MLKFRRSTKGISKEMMGRQGGKDVKLLNAKRCGVKRVSRTLKFGTWECVIDRRPKRCNVHD